MTITGSGFAGATGVRIDDSNTCTEGVASFTVNNDTSITAVTAFPDECFVNYPGFDFRVITPPKIAPSAQVTPPPPFLIQPFPRCSYVKRRP